MATVERTLREEVTPGVKLSVTRNPSARDGTEGFEVTVEDGDDEQALARLRALVGALRGVVGAAS